MSEGLCPRALRAAVFAAACVLLSAVTYAVVGRGAAPLWAVLVALAVVFPLAWAGSSRTRGLAAICALAAVVQLGLDYWFSLAQIDETVVRGCGLIQALPPMGETISCARTAAPSPAPAALTADGALHVGITLLLVQLLVALVSAICLSSGEHAQSALRERLAASGAHVLLRWWPVFALALTRLAPPADPEHAAPAPSTRQARPKRLDLRYAVLRRGPPAPSCTALG